MSDAIETRLLELLEKINDKLGKIETGLALQTQMLDSHTASDTANFSALSTAMSRVQSDLDSIKLARAVEAGEKKADEKSNRNSTLAWGGSAAALVTGLVELIRQFWPHS